MAVWHVCQQLAQELKKGFLKHLGKLRAEAFSPTALMLWVYVAVRQSLGTAASTPTFVIPAPGASSHWGGSLTSPIATHWLQIFCFFTSKYLNTEKFICFYLNKVWLKEDALLHKVQTKTRASKDADEQYSKSHLIHLVKHKRPFLFWI